MKFNTWTWLFLLAVAVIIIMWQCRKEVVPVLPPIKPVSEIKQEVKNNEDSINAIIATLEIELEQKDKLIEKASDELETGQNKSKQLLSENAALRAQLKAGELTDNINNNSNKLAEQIRKNDSLCNKNISLLTKKVTTKDAIINQKDRLYKKLKSSLDTCLKNQSALEKYSKQVKPKRELYAGIMYMGNVNRIFNGYGVKLGLRTKKGEYIDFGAMQISGTTNWMVSYSRTIFK